MRKRRQKRIVRHSEAFKERTVWPQRGFSCVFGAHLAEMIEARDPVGFLMYMEITRPHAAPRKAHKVIVRPLEEKPTRGET